MFYLYVTIFTPEKIFVDFIKVCRVKRPIIQKISCKKVTTFSYAVIYFLICFTICDIKLHNKS